MKEHRDMRQYSVPPTPCLYPQNQTIPSQCLYIVTTDQRESGDSKNMTTIFPYSFTVKS